MPLVLRQFDSGVGAHLVGVSQYAGQQRHSLGQADFREHDRDLTLERPVIGKFL